MGPRGGGESPGAEEGHPMRKAEKDIVHEELDYVLKHGLPGQRRAIMGVISFFHRDASRREETSRRQYVLAKKARQKGETIIQEGRLKATRRQGGGSRYSKGRPHRRALFCHPWLGCYRMVKPVHWKRDGGGIGLISLA